MVEKLNKITRKERELRGELRREPQNYEIADELDMTEDEVIELRRLAQPTVSLDKPVGDEEETTLGQFVVDETEEAPDIAVERTAREQALYDALENLPERDRKVLELRFGLYGQHPHTLEEVGKARGVTRERVRQIERDLMNRLAANQNFKAAVSDPENFEPKAGSPTGETIDYEAELKASGGTMLGDFSAKESLVAAYILQGLSKEQIAHRLGQSKNTIRQVSYSMYDKLELEDKSWSALGARIKELTSQDIIDQE
jgi:RNA polymerase sigma factor (sigma-70 family)